MLKLFKWLAPTRLSKTLKARKEEWFLPPCHFVLKQWTKKYRLRLSPVCCAVAGVMLFWLLLAAAMLTLAVIALTLFGIIGASVLSGTLQITVITALSALIVFQAAASRDEILWSLISRTAQCVGTEPRELWFRDENNLRLLARLKLQSLAIDLETAEEKTPPLSKEREDARTKFQQVYAEACHLGLIEDTGYGRYFKS